MGVKIVVDTQNLLITSSAIVEKADAYKRAYENLLGEVNGMGRNWQGIDNAAYVNQINGFRDDFEQLDKLLRQYAEMLQIVDKEYEITLKASCAVANTL